MNFLAHALLAGDEPALIVGGVVGDWIKGPLPGSLPDDLAKGVALHRAIDSFAESQASFQRSRSRVSPSRRRYAGVLTDIFYDHLLARDWARLHHIPLHQYCQSIYSAIDDRLDDLPAASHPGLKLMASENWLSSYAQLEGIADVLARMSRRARRPNPLKHGEQEFLADASGYTEDFHQWLAEIRTFCLCWQQNDTACVTPGEIPANRPANDLSSAAQATFELWRLDDNANEFLVAKFTERTSAELKLREMAAGGHKQTYWIKPPSPR